MCKTCKSEMVAVLNARIRKVLQVAEDEGGPEAVEDAEAKCFHFMELIAKLEGKPTSGVYD